MRVTAAFSTLVAALSLTSPVLAARNKVFQSSDGVGCTAQIASSSTGFNAKFYDYPQADLIRFNQDTFVANKYTTAAVIGTATGVVEPSIIQSGIPNHATLTNYNITDIDVYHTALELRGYFVRMYYITLSFFFPQSFPKFRSQFCCCYQKSQRFSCSPN